MKLIIILVVLPFFVGSCDKGTKEPDPIKIQQNNSLTPICDHLFSLSTLPIILNCPKGKPVCGTKSGQNEIKGYCIDANDVLLSEANCVSDSDKSYIGSSQCIQSEAPEETTVMTTIQKSSNFRAACLHSAEVQCPENGTPTCGTVNQGITIEVYCVDQNDNTLPDSASCSSGYTPTCEPMEPGGP